MGKAPLARPDLGVAVADLLTTPAWVIGGIVLWRRQALGYAAGLGLLFQASMLFVGLLAVLALQPLLSATPFPLADFVVILVMSSVCLVPFALHARRDFGDARLALNTVANRLDPARRQVP